MVVDAHPYVVTGGLVTYATYQLKSVDLSHHYSCARRLRTVVHKLLYVLRL